MVDYVLEWANLRLRWAHVITAVAWIGSYFYFVFLDNSLTKPEDPELKAKGVGGELWAVHGGGFYHSQKYLVEPQKIPQNLHWLHWKSYSTWLTGFSLFTVMYLGFLVVFWLAYDALCKIFDRKEKWGCGRRPCGPWLRGADIRAGMPPVLGAPRISAGRRHDRHNAQVQNKGITLLTQEWVKKNALTMYQQAVVLKLMPINNVTQITDSERYNFSAGLRPAPRRTNRGNQDHPTILGRNTTY
jgi:uncharacterized membrane protein